MSDANPLSNRPTYTPQQIHQIYDRVNLPSRYRYEPGDFSREVVKHRDGHGFLAALVSHALAYIPFENLELHYSSHHTVSIHPDALFDKIVKQGTGRGGYPLENNVFLGTVLRSVGYEVMSVGARLNILYDPDGESEGNRKFGGWSHMVNLVTIRDKVFLVDVGFGSGGPICPLPLKEGTHTVTPAKSQLMRLRRDAIAENEYQGNKLWLVERRIANDGAWTSLYCFENFVCFLPQDFEVMNFYASMHRTSVFTYHVFVVKYTLSEDQETVEGEMILRGDRVLRRVDGETERLATLRTEEDRIDALQRYFDIKLNSAQIAGIQGTVSALSSRRIRPA